MSTTHAPLRAKSKPGRGAAQAGGSSGASPARAAAAESLGALQHAGPAFGLGGVQRQVAIGKAGDSHEQEADAVAEKVAAGKSVGPNDISKVEPGALAQSMAADEHPPVQKAEAPKMPEKKPDAVQKAEAKPPEQKVDDKKPVQKAEAGKPEEKKPVQKAEVPKMPENKPDAVQKAEAKPPEQKVDDKKPVQKAEAGKPEEKKPVQKAEAKPPEQKVDDKKPVQKAEAGKPEEKKPVQKAEAPKMPEKKADAVQKAEAKPPEQKVDDKKPVQKDGAVGGGPGASGGGNMAAAAGQAIASKGAGQPLNQSTRGRLESGLGVDLGHVRVHDDARAREAASDLNARAFTHGSDIWLGEGASQQDTQLMAHEATHVVQQAGGVHRMVQRDTPKKADGKKPAADPASLDGKTVKIPKLRLPSYDRKANSINFPFPLPAKKPERPNDQRKVLADDIAADSAFATNVASKIQNIKYNDGQKIRKTESKKTGAKNYFLKPSGDNKRVIVGDEKTLLPKLYLPTWDKGGKYHSYDAEHIKEIQLGGDNLASNMELLDSSANRSSGSSIHHDIESKTGAAAKQLGEEGKIPKTIKNIDDLRANGYTVEFTAKDASYKVAGNPDEYWTRDKLKEATHVDGLAPMTEKEIKEITGDETHLSLINSRGLKLKSLDGWEQGKTSYPIQNFFPAFDLETVDFTPGSGGKLSGTLFPKHPPLAVQKVTWDIQPEPGIDYGGSIPVSLKKLGLLGMSPMEVHEVDIGQKGLFARGAINPTVPLLRDKKIDIDFLIEGSEIEVSKTFNTGEFAFPGPIKVSDSSLTLAIRPSKFSLTGQLDFAIERVGEGTLKGEGDTSEGFSLEGKFLFDKKLFDDAEIEAWYRKDEFGAKGRVGIKSEGKIKGIKSATIEASYEKGKLAATGKADLSIPGIKSANLGLEYSEKEGLAIGGGFQLADNIPGIKSGSGEAKIKEKPDGSGYDVSATGKAVPNIPGLNTQLTLSYDNGAVTLEGTAGYEKGKLKGSVAVGVSNRPVGGDGKPAGEPGKTFQVYGGGSLSLKLAPWLQATAGVMFKPNGEIQISGEIGLPEALNIFPEKKLDKNIFKIGIDIPIVGVSVAGQRIGIFANITGGLDLSAGIGPGQLQALKLKVDYNPDHEDQTHVQGDAKLHVPAHAGLRMFVRGGLGVGIPIVSAQAGIEVGGQLGLEGALDTGVHVDWSPAKGLSLDANAEVYVEPKLKFDVTGFVLVEADLLLTTIELYSKRWQLAGFEYGSGLRFGVSFPVHYEEGKELNLSLDNVKFQVPDIKPKDMLSDLIKKIA